MENHSPFFDTVDFFTSSEFGNEWRNFSHIFDAVDFFTRPLFGNEGVKSVLM